MTPNLALISSSSSSLFRLNDATSTLPRLGGLRPIPKRGVRESNDLPYWGFLSGPYWLNLWSGLDVLNLVICGILFYSSSIRIWLFFVVPTWPFSVWSTVYAFDNFSTLGAFLAPRWAQEAPRGPKTPKAASKTDFGAILVILK